MHTRMNQFISEISRTQKNHMHHNIVKIMVDCILFHLQFDCLMQLVFGTLLHKQNTNDVTQLEIHMLKINSELPL
jgi:hypothetical protein